MRLLTITWTVCAVSALLGPISLAEADVIPEIHDILSRGFVSTNAFGDASLGNGWTRTDNFTNVDSGQYSIRLDSVQWLFLNPEDVGYSDITNANGLSVIAAAASSYPDYMFGASFWTNKNPPAVTWTNSGNVVSLGGVWLDPGEYSALQTTAHNNIMGIAGSTSDNWDLVGEVVVGWKFSGAVALVPEPASAILLAVGGVMVVYRRRR